MGNDISCVRNSCTDTSGQIDTSATGNMLEDFTGAQNCGSTQYPKFSLHTPEDAFMTAIPENTNEEATLNDSSKGGPYTFAKDDSSNSSTGGPYTFAKDNGPYTFAKDDGFHANLSTIEEEY